jgi:hypothetical protein
MLTIESERLLIMRDYAGALSAATRHLENPALGLYSTRDRALAVAVQALHELGRGEEALAGDDCAGVGIGGARSRGAAVGPIAVAFAKAGAAELKRRPSTGAAQHSAS